MACEQPTHSTIIPNYPARTLVAHWWYEGNSHRGFILELYRKMGDPPVWTRVDVRTTFRAGRKYTFRKMHMGDGQVWKVRITTQCENCTLSATDESDEVTLTFPTPD